MTTYTIKDYYTRHRAAGKPAKQALELAKQWQAAKRSPWDIKTSKATYYNRQSDSGGRWIENASASLRLVGYADEISKRIDHKGWYTDNDLQHEVLRGVVYRLPARNGQSVYAYGYADPCNDDCAYLVFDTSFNDDEISAAYAADRIAQHSAEEQCLYNEAYHAGSNYAETGETIKTERKQCLGLLAAIRVEKSRGAAPVICDVLRAQVKRHLASIREAREERDKLRDDFSRSWRKDVWAAFNDGAGELVIV